MIRTPSVRLLFQATVCFAAAVMSAVCIGAAGLAFHGWRQAARAEAVVVIARDLFTAMQNLRAERGSVVAGLDGAPLDPENARRVADVRTRADAALRAALAGLSRARGPAEPQAARALADAMRGLAVARRRADESRDLDPAARAKAVQAWLPADDLAINAVADLSQRLSFDVARDDPFVGRMAVITRLAWTSRAAAGSAWMELHSIMRQGTPPTPEQRETLASLEGQVGAAWGLLRENLVRSDAPPALKAAVARADALYFDQTTSCLKALLADLEAGRPTSVSGPAWLNAARSGLASLMEAPTAAFDLARRHAHAQAEEAERRFYTVLAFMLVVLALAWAGAFALNRRFVRPMADLTRATRAVAAGRLSHEIPYQDRRDEIGALAQALGVFRDNALAKARIEQALSRSEIAVRTAEAASEIKSQFLANMSHEIRTPLNGVLGMVQAMQLEETTPAQRERLRIIRDSGETLLQILNDVLDFSKIEAGKLELSVGPFDIKDLVRRTCAIFDDMAGAKGLELRWTVTERAEGLWAGDPARIRQMLMNLLSNAVKFTTAGWISVTADADAGGLRLTVRDTGVGIEPEHLPRLFSKFSQVDESSTRRFGGTGLGLAICRELAGLMDGEVEVESARGRGSAFRIRLPLARVDAAMPALATPAQEAETGHRPADRPLRILAAEDNPINQKVLAALLSALGADLTLVSSGQEAIDAWRTDAWDVILMDIQMPDMSGVEATRRIREAEAAQGQARTPIIAVSANAMQHQKDEYRAAGMELHVAKPIQAAELYAAVQAALATGESDILAGRSG